MDEGVCYVNIQYARVLRLTRILCAAPVYLTRVDRGYRVAVSQKHVIYSCTITSLLAISVVIGAFYYTYFVHEAQEQFIIPFFIIRVLGDITSKILSITLIAYNGRKRFKRIIKYLIRINEINAALDSEYINTKLKKSAEIFWSISTLLIIVDFAVQLCNTPNPFNLDKAYAVASIGIYYLISTCVYIIEIQYIYILCLIKSTTNIFNRRLRFCFTEAPFSLLSIASVRTNTNHFFRVYVSLCDLIADFNNDEGVMILSFILFHIFNIVISDILIYINQIIKNPMNVWLWASLVFFIHKFIRFAVFVEACHRVNVEDVRQLVSELSATSRGAHAHLKCFEMNMLLHDPVIAPLGLFAITRTFVVMILGGMVTYVTILNQFYNNTFH